MTEDRTIESDQPIPSIPVSESGLEDRSEELEERTEKDVRIRFYQSMASIDEDRPGLAHTICRAVASVMYDFCVMHLRKRDGDLALAAAHDVNDALRSSVEDLVAVGGIIPCDALERAASEGRMSSVEPEESPTLIIGNDGDQRVRVHSVVVAPLKTTRGELFGAISVGRHATTRRYDAVDRALLEWIASHVSMKLETARLHRDLKKTNRKLSVKAAELEEAVRARDIFLATASHELKTPLSTLALQVELIERELEGLPALVENTIGQNVRSVGRQVQRLSGLVCQLLDVSRLAEGQLELDVEAVDMANLAAEIVARFQLEARRAGVEIELRVDPCPGVWDPSRLDQIIANLLSNAIKYGGTRVRVEVVADDKDAILRVWDDGIGIPEQDRQRVFERFERAAPQRAGTGLGLGLWIVKQLVERFDGEITISDGLEGGSCFCVTLSRNAGPIASPNSSPSD